MVDSGSQKARRGRPKASVEQYRRAFLLYTQGNRHKEIFEALENEFGTEGRDKRVSERTLYEWERVFKQYFDATGIESEQYSWHRTSEYEGISWESGAYLLGLSKHPGLQHPHGSTVRDMRWCWRIHLAAPELEAHEVLVLAHHYGNRQIAHDLHGEPLQMDDLDMLLMYRPWSSAESRSEYREAQESGRIQESIAANLCLERDPEETWPSYFNRTMPDDG
jgi:hypothetical protein